MILQGYAVDKGGAILRPCNFNDKHLAFFEDEANIVDLDKGTLYGQIPDRTEKQIIEIQDIVF